MSYLHKIKYFLEFIGSLISIFIFLTGVYSLPILFSKNPSSHPAAVDYPAFSYGFLIISQCVFFFCYFVIIRYLYNRMIINYFKFDDECAKTLYFFVCIFFGFGLSFLFAEGFWGPVNTWGRFEYQPPLPAIFLGLSALANFFTVLFSLNKTVP